MAEQPQLQPQPKGDPTLPSSAEEDPAKWWLQQEEYYHAAIQQRASRRRRRRAAIVCCGCCTALVAVVAVLLLVLALTIYRVRDPEVTLNGIFFTNSSTSHGGDDDEHHQGTVLGGVLADVSMRNPNKVAYYFEESYTSFYCAGSKVAGAYGPPGWAEAGKTYRFNMTVDVNATALEEAADEIERDEMRADSTTAIRGHVRILGMFRHQVDLNVRCTITLDVGNWTVVGQSCSEKVWD